MSDNPYAPPSTDYLVASHLSPASSDVEAIRKHYLKHETSVKSIGLLYLLGAIVLIPAGLFLTVAGVAGLAPDSRREMPGMMMVSLGVIYVALGSLQAATAISIRRLKSWARIVAVGFSCLGLFGFPIGTLISIYILWLLLSQKGKFIFTDEYRQVVAATPHIKYRTSLVVKILLAIMGLLLLLGVVGFIVAGMRG